LETTLNFERNSHALARRIRGTYVVVERFADPVSADVFQTLPYKKPIGADAPTLLRTPRPDPSAFSRCHLSGLGSSLSVYDFQLVAQKSVVHLTVERNPKSLT
jgi:hypothetical protein